MGQNYGNGGRWVCTINPPRLGQATRRGRCETLNGLRRRPDGKDLPPPKHRGVGSFPSCPPAMKDSSLWGNTRSLGEIRIRLDQGPFRSFGMANACQPYFCSMNKPLINKGYSGIAQFGMLMLLVGGGLILASIISIGVWTAMTGSSPLDLQKEMLNPQNANAVKVLQMLSTLFGFFIPAVAFAFICFRNGWNALGFGAAPVVKYTLIGLGLLLAAQPLIEVLSTLNKAIPISESMRLASERMEASYEEQVKVIGDVSSTGKFILSLIMVALLPAVFEEILFRGALQGLFERWFKNGWVAIIVTAILFSAIHLSWYGLIPRIALGILLGAIFYYTRNIWYPIIVHFLNNAFIVCYMFYLHLNGKEFDMSESTSFPWWASVIAAVAVVYLFRILHREQESKIPQEIYRKPNDPFNQFDSIA